MHVYLTLSAEQRVRNNHQENVEENFIRPHEDNDRDREDPYNHLWTKTRLQNLSPSLRMNKEDLKPTKGPMTKYCKTMESENHSEVWEKQTSKPD